MHSINYESEMTLVELITEEGGTFVVEKEREIFFMLIEKRGFH